MASILDSILLDPVPRNVTEVALKHWNKGVFDYELLQQGLVANSTSGSAASSALQRLVSTTTSGSASTVPQRLQEGTYAGTQLALTEMFDRIEHSFATWFNVLGIEPNIPRPLTLGQKREMYKYQPRDKDRYPPHLDSIPTKDQVSKFEIFDTLGLLQVAALLPNIVPKNFLSTIASGITGQFREWVFGDPEQGITIADIEQQNRTNRKSGTDIMRGTNIGDLDDWYTDARFAQQYLTGTNPTTIQLLSPAFLVEFREAAKNQGRNDISDILVDANKSSLYMTDCSYFRKALQVGPYDPIVLKSDDKDEPARYGCASVTLFQLHGDGKLHPLGIVIDYTGTMKESVTLFNKRISPSDPTRGEFWPWRYAKTCAQSSDWTLHEITVHLVNTHFIEEAIIVATHRNIPVDNIVYQILEPHWFRTLSLNAAARETLVPKVVLGLTGYSEDQGYKFINHAYSNFNFKERYVPKDLKTRGFDPAELSTPRFRNSVYAQNIILMWNAIRTFVNSMVRLKYKTPADVTGDDHITKWYEEIQSDRGAKIPSFPKITTVDELVDAITMCIHIASPQHSAVNYLQSFYQTFVINKPPCLFHPLPSTLDSLKSVTESFLVKSLPIGHQRQWLLAAHIPWLLSFRPAEDNNLINYAASLYNVYKKKGPEERGPEITAIAKAFYDGLVKLIDTFEKQSQGMGEKERMIKYRVLDPREAAVSILI